MVTPTSIPPGLPIIPELLLLRRRQAGEADLQRAAVMNELESVTAAGFAHLHGSVLEQEVGRSLSPDAAVKIAEESARTNGATRTGGGMVRPPWLRGGMKKAVLTAVVADRAKLPGALGTVGCLLPAAKLR